MFKGLRKAIRPISFFSIWMWSGRTSGNRPKVVSILLIYHIYIFRHKSTSIFILISTSIVSYHRGNTGTYTAIPEPCTYIVILETWTYTTILETCTYTVILETWTYTTILERETLHIHEYVNNCDPLCRSMP